MTETTSTAFIVQTHYLTPRILKLISRAKALGIYDVHVVGFFYDRDAIPKAFEAPGFHAYLAEDLVCADYAVKAREEPFRYVPGNCDLLFLRFLRDHPQYKRIWSWEGDVEFTGPLSKICRAFDTYDSDLTCTLLDWPHKKWHFRHLSRVPAGWPADLDWPVTGLLSMFRGSRTFFEALDRFYRDGGDGHFEWVWPYVARAAGLTYEDFGGDGPFVRPQNRNRFYRAPRHAGLAPGTFRYRPTMSVPGRRKNTLYHPVKDKPVPVGESFAQHKRMLRLGLSDLRRGELRYGSPADPTSLQNFGSGKRDPE